MVFGLNQLHSPSYIFLFPQRRVHVLWHESHASHTDLLYIAAICNVCLYTSVATEVTSFPGHRWSASEAHDHGQGWQQSGLLRWDCHSCSCEGVGTGLLSRDLPKDRAVPCPSVLPTMARADRGAIVYIEYTVFLLTLLNSSLKWFKSLRKHDFDDIENRMPGQRGTAQGYAPVNIQ